MKRKEGVVGGSKTKIKLGECIRALWMLIVVGGNEGRKAEGLPVYIVCVSSVLFCSSVAVHCTPLIQSMSMNDVGVMQEKFAAFANDHCRLGWMWEHLIESMVKK